MTGRLPRPGFSFFLIVKPLVQDIPFTAPFRNVPPIGCNLVSNAVIDFIFLSQFIEKGFFDLPAQCRFLSLGDKEEPLVEESIQNQVRKMGDSFFT